MQSENQRLWFCSVRLVPFCVFAEQADISEKFFFFFCIVLFIYRDFKKAETLKSSVFQPLLFTHNHFLFGVIVFKFGSFQCSSVRLRCQLFVFVSRLLRLSSTAGRSYPSRRSTPGSCRHKGSSHLLRGCCGHGKRGLEP